MICSHRKFVNRNLRLAAYAAAGHFILRRFGAGDRRNAWCAIALRFARRRGRSATLVASRPIPRFRVSYFQHFHFHFVTSPNATVWPLRQSRVSTGQGERQARVLMDHRWTNTTVSPSVQPNAIEPPSRDFQEPKNLRGGTRRRRSSASTIRFVPFNQRTFARTSLTAIRPLREPMLQVRPNLRQEVRTQISQTYSQVRHHQNQIFSLNRTVFADATPSRRPAIKSLQSQYERPAEIVWRRRAHKTSATAEPVHESEAREPSREEPRSKQVDQSVQDVTVFANEAAASNVAKLDAAVLERITDNVINQVEKRMRIERQRRGI